MNPSKFIQELIAIWQNGAIEKIETIYHQDIIGTINNQKIDFADIKNRVMYLHKHHQDKKFEIRNIIAEDNNIAIHMLYSAYDTHANSQVASPTMAFYKLRDSKISQVDIVSGTTIDYFAKP